MSSNIKIVVTDMQSSSVIFSNCFLPKDGKLRHCRVTVKDTRTEKIELVSDAEYGQIIFSETFGNSSTTNDESKVDEITTFECAGHILSPGFIDIQLNGCFGVDFSNPSLMKEDILRVATHLLRFGVTCFCPTMVSSSKESYAKLIPLIGGLCLEDRSSTKPVDRASLWGMHLEGPFFSASKRGAHEAQCIIEEVKVNSLSDVYDRGVGELFNAGVAITTLAPELPGAINQIRDLCKHGIIVSMGHTDATINDGLKAIKNGASLITHLFNAMRPFHHREPGLLGVLCSDEKDEIYYSIIADGLHSHPTSVKMAYAISKNVVLVTDAMSALGLGDGEHSLGAEKVTVKNSKAVISGTDTLAGSVASMDSCVRSFHKFTGCSIYEALKAATENPARVLKQNTGLGVITVGRPADFVILDSELNVLRTIVAGSVVFSNDADKA
jgi:N-acetylglucosamine-6-phosphate deacetylase